MQVPVGCVCGYGGSGKDYESGVVLLLATKFASPLKGARWDHAHVADSGDMAMCFCVWELRTVGRCFCDTLGLPIGHLGIPAAVTVTFWDDALRGHWTDHSWAQYQGSIVPRQQFGVGEECICCVQGTDVAELASSFVAGMQE